MRAGDAAAPLELAFWGETPTTHASHLRRDARRRWRHVIIEALLAAARRRPPPAAELRALLAERFAAAPAGAWITRLTAAGLSAQVARDVQENMADPVHVALASASCATIPNLAGSAMSGVRVGSRAPRSTPCSRGRRSGATAARSSKRAAGAPALASSSPTGLSQ